MMGNNQPPKCPFCGFVPTQEQDEYELILVRNLLCFSAEQY